VREVGVGVVDAGEQADLALLEQALHAAVEAGLERGVHAEAGPAELGRVVLLEARAQVGVAAVLGERDEAVEQVAAAGQEDRDEHRRVRRGGRGRLGGAEDVGYRHRARGVDGEARAHTAREDLTAGDSRVEVRAAGGLAGRVEVVAGAVGVLGHQWRCASGPDRSR
jgi:hypothetical protein